MTIHEFIEKHGLSMVAVPTDSNPHMDSDGAEVDHWSCDLERKSPVLSLRVPFSCGIGHRRWKEAPNLPSMGIGYLAEFRKLSPVKRYGERESVDLHNAREKFTEPTPPELADVLDCLAMDASGYDNARDFEDWAGDYGYDTDSRKAEATYRVIGDQSKRLRHFLGADAYRELIEDVDRL